MSNKVHFEGAPDWVHSAAIDRNGALYWFNAYTCQLRTDEYWGEHRINAYEEDLPSYPDYGHKGEFVGMGYDTDDWENSAVDREEW